MAAADDAVGYGKPPRHTQWKKGQSGNPRGHRRVKATLQPRDIVENIFTTMVTITENGNVRHVTIFEAILLRLLIKVANGSARAQRLLDKYKAFSASRPEIYVITEEERQQMSDAYARTLE